MKRLFKTIFTFIFFLLEPEDSITGVRSQNEIKSRKQMRSTGLIKAMLWMAISIAVGVAVSSL